MKANLLEPNKTNNWRLEINGCTNQAWQIIKERFADLQWPIEDRGKSMWKMALPFFQCGFLHPTNYVLIEFWHTNQDIILEAAEYLCSQINCELDIL